MGLNIQSCMTTNIVAALPKFYPLITHFLKIFISLMEYIMDENVEGAAYKHRKHDWER